MITVIEKLKNDESNDLKNADCFETRFALTD